MGTVRAGKKGSFLCGKLGRRCLNRVEGAEDMVSTRINRLDWVEVVQKYQRRGQRKDTEERRSGEVVPSPANAAVKMIKIPLETRLKG